jgi:hypothetical protein
MRRAPGTRGRSAGEGGGHGGREEFARRIPVEIEGVSLFAAQ